MSSPSIRPDKSADEFRTESISEESSKTESTPLLETAQKTDSAGRSALGVIGKAASKVAGFFKGIATTIAASAFGKAISNFARSVVDAFVAQHKETFHTKNLVAKQKGILEIINEIKQAARSPEKQAEGNEKLKEQLQGLKDDLEHITDDDKKAFVKGFIDKVEAFSKGIDKKVAAPEKHVTFEDESSSSDIEDAPLFVGERKRGEEVLDDSYDAAVVGPGDEEIVIEDPLNKTLKEALDKLEDLEVKKKEEPVFDELKNHEKDVTEQADTASVLDDLDSLTTAIESEEEVEEVPDQKEEIAKESPEREAKLQKMGKDIVGLNHGTPEEKAIQGQLKKELDALRVKISEMKPKLKDAYIAVFNLKVKAALIKENAIGAKDAFQQQIKDLTKLLKSISKKYRGELKHEVKSYQRELAEDRLEKIGDRIQALIDQANAGFESPEGIKEQKEKYQAEVKGLKKHLGDASNEVAKILLGRIPDLDDAQRLTNLQKSGNKALDQTTEQLDRHIAFGKALNGLRRTMNPVLTALLKEAQKYDSEMESFEEIEDQSGGIAVWEKRKAAALEKFRGMLGLNPDKQTGAVKEISVMQEPPVYQDKSKALVSAWVDTVRKLMPHYMKGATPKQIEDEEARINQIEAELKEIVKGLDISHKPVDNTRIAAIVAGLVRPALRLLPPPSQ